ncbi:TPA: hypothetical protein ACSP0D_003392 [Aeromonas veronii]
MEDKIMRAMVYDHTGKSHELDLAAIPGLDIKPDPQFMDGEYLNIFTASHRVPDVWRYTISSMEGAMRLHSIDRSDALPNSNYDDRPATDAIGTRVIQLVLESPHTSEYTDNLVPKGPAQGTSVGDAGGAIEKYLHLVLKKIELPEGRFSILVTNPIPYMCSLGRFTGSLVPAVRDSVWERIWAMPSFPKNFVSRTAMYLPEYVVNCCTTKLQPNVTESLKQSGIVTNIFEAPHPAVQWNIHKENVRIVKVC